MDNHGEMGIDQIMERVRKEVARRKSAAASTGPLFLEHAQPVCKQQEMVPVPTVETRFWRFLKTVQSRLQRYALYHLIHPVALRMKRYIPSHRMICSVDELSKYHDAEFIRNAYRGILRRDPDPKGFDYYLAKLRQGERKSEILGKLRYSKEGRQNNVAIRGLLVRFLVETSFRIPILGYFLDIMASIVRLPKALRYIRQCEAFTNIRFAQQSNSTNALSAGFETKAMQIRQILTTKADTHFVEEVRGLLAAKADAGGVNELRRQLETKADAGGVNELRRQLETKADAELVSGIRKELQNILHQMRDHKLNILEQQRRLVLLIEEARKRFPKPISTKQLESMIKEEDHVFDAMYVTFEDEFRGTREDIKERLKVYLPYVDKIISDSESDTILDVGCGRGEWLELLRDHGFRARGVDCNGVMIRRCRELDLDVIDSEAIAYLRKQKPNRFKVITGFHILEHLPFRAMIELLDESLRLLRPGGIVIFETPNPENLIVGSCSFYFDPTHRRPIPPPQLMHIVEQRGFVKPEIMRLHPYEYFTDPLVGNGYNDKILNLFTNAQDYSVIAYSPY